MFRVIIAGSRTFTDYQRAKSILDEVLQKHTPRLVVLCGCARGADELGKRWAEENNIPVLKYPAEWDRFGKSAGFKRNEEMAGKADCLIAFWDFKSRGTGHMIDIARVRKLECHVFPIP